MTSHNYLVVSVPWTEVSRTQGKIRRAKNTDRTFELFCTEYSRWLWRRGNRDECGIWLKHIKGMGDEKDKWLIQKDEKDKLVSREYLTKQGAERKLKALSNGREHFWLVRQLMRSATVEKGWRVSANFCSNMSSVENVEIKLFKNHITIIYTLPSDIRPMFDMPHPFGMRNLQFSYITINNDTGVFDEFYSANCPKSCMYVEAVQTDMLDENGKPVMMHVPCAREEEICQVQK